jgi:hypothetical protein
VPVRGVLEWPCAQRITDRPIGQSGGCAAVTVQSHGSISSQALSGLKKIYKTISSVSFTVCHKHELRRFRHARSLQSG